MNHTHHAAFIMALLGICALTCKALSPEEQSALCDLAVAIPGLEGKPMGWNTSDASKACLWKGVFCNAAGNVQSLYDCQSPPLYEDLFN